MQSQDPVPLMEQPVPRDGSAHKPLSPLQPLGRAQSQKPGKAAELGPCKPPPRPVLALAHPASSSHPTLSLLLLPSVAGLFPDLARLPFGLMFTEFFSKIIRPQVLSLPGKRSDP